MNDYIKRSDAIQALVSITAYNSVEEIQAACFDSYARTNGWLGGVMESITALAEGVPAADLQPVVYCKDCTLSRENGFFCTSTFHGGMTFPNDFCSSGERRGAKMGGDT